MRLREAVQDGQDLEGNILAGGKPSTGTPKDKRLKSNSTKVSKSGGGKVSAPRGKVPVATPAKVTHGF